MSDPILTQVAVAAAGETAKALVAGGKTAVAKLGQALRRKVATNDADRAAVAALAEDQTNPELAARVVELLVTLADNDARFAAELRAAQQERRDQVRIDEVGTLNYIGQAEKVVQIHENHGDITL